MSCKRGHGSWFQIKVVGRKTKFCDHIMGYRQSEGKDRSVIFCGDLKIGEKIPKGYMEVSGEII